MTDIYFNIAERTGGEIYAGVVGPVRTGKSTFIKRFMELFVVPAMEDTYGKTRVIDQLPQSGAGRTITTTEPKFIPEEAAKIRIGSTELAVRMVDCVGYIVPGVLGHEENGKSRMVKTPWDDREISFEEAAEKGTTKVITDHSTIGILVTTDGSFGEIGRESFVPAEARAAEKLKALGKPYIIVLNSSRPEGYEAAAIAKSIEAKYNVPVVTVNCMTMDEGDFERIFQGLLSQFPVSEVYIDLPDYMEALAYNHPVKASLMETAFEWMKLLGNMAGLEETMYRLTVNDNIEKAEIVRKEMATGKVYVDIRLKEGLYYSIIEEILGQPVDGDKTFFRILRQCADARNRMEKMAEALSSAENAGYGIVHPDLSRMSLEKPEVFKQGNKYGVRMVANAPCLHMIKTNLTTEIAPLVGSQQQSEDLTAFLLEKYQQAEADGDMSSIWHTNLFGKTIQELVMEQMNSKLTTMPETLQIKVQKSLQKISNEGKDYFICIII